MKKIFSPETYSIKDCSEVPFINKNEILELLATTKEPSLERIKQITKKSFSKTRLSLSEVAELLNVENSESVEFIKSSAQHLKKEIYGNRIVLFAPLYIGNRCINDCSYCGFSISNMQSIRKTLFQYEIEKEVVALENSGHKRLILVYGEHPLYSAKMIADNVRQVYKVKSGNGEIRRVNINAAPFSIEDFKIIKEAGIGTFQVFQETYDPELYAIHHPRGSKSDFNNRLTSLDRAMVAGIDDVGIGALFGLGDWKFEVMGLMRHVNHLESVYNVGPHTISFPRIKEASGVDGASYKGMNDDDFLKMIAILRLAVPYTGMILTARESKELRDIAISYGISQIDGGTKIEIGAYSANEESQNLDKEQFEIADDRSLKDVINELTENNFIPSFCTACYRKGRTGEHFMEFSVPGFIKRFCTPNALFSYAEYLEDYATDEQKSKGYKIIDANLAEMEHCMRDVVKNRLEEIRQGKRDMFL